MPVEHVSLCRCRVLYLGSAIPIETAVGIESIQMPCRERYDNVDSNQKAAGIDSSLSIYSSGLMLQYTADPASSTWFPIQTLHVCAAVKAVQGGGPLRFVSLDTSAAQGSSSPPLFACIMRRTKGIKVLECHVFVCKSNQAAMALVQSCTHAFEHKEGWLDSMPPSASRIVSAGGRGGSSGGGKSVRGGNFFSDRSDLIQKFDVACRVGDGPKPCAQMMVPMNPPGAPVPMLTPAVPNEYFADWNMYGGQPLMIIPESPFYSGECAAKKKKKKKKPKKKKAKDESSEEEETIFVKKSELEGRVGYYGDSLRSRLRGRTCVEEIVQAPKPAPQIIYMPQPAPAVKAQTNPNTDVVVYAPQVIEANKDIKSYEYEHADRNVMDYRPDNRSYRVNNERRMYDGRQDNRVDYNRQNYDRRDYRADERSYSNREDNRRMDYRADNRSNRVANAAAAYGGGGGEMYDPEYDAEFEQGYYDAQYNAEVAEYNRQLAEYYNDEDGGYYADEDYYPQPGYTDDYGGWDYARQLPAADDGGRYELDYVDDYVVDGGQSRRGRGGGIPRQNYRQVADGLGYYP